MPPPPMICDFCSETPVRWLYDCATFDMPQGVQSQGAWATCDTCADIIERRDKTALANRLPKEKAFRIPAIRAAQLQFRAAFWKHLTGTRTAVDAQTAVPIVPHRADRPWMAALEMQFTTLRRVASVTPQAAWVDHLRRAETYAWTPEPLQAVYQAAMSMPDSATIDRAMLPSPAGYWYLPATPDYSGPTAVLWAIEPDRDERWPEILLLSMWGPTETVGSGDPVELRVFAPWPIGMSITEAMTRHEQAQKQEVGPSAEAQAFVMMHRWLMRLFVAGCVWLQQRILVTSTGQIERHRRKQLMRDYQAPLKSDVKIIELRRRESVSSASSDSGAVEWSCQWIVNGHWTHQVHGAKRGERRLQYILPYVKGPADKPLKVPKQTVYVVDR